jgi:uncharacterized protein YbjT (DUF2867 family)
MTNSSKSRVLIAGATGYVGSRLAPRLRNAGYAVRCIARNTEKLINRNWTDIDIVQGDLNDRQSLRAAMKDMDIAVYLVHAMSSDGDFAAKDLHYAENFARVAAESKIKRIIYLGGVGSSDQKLSHHLESRQNVGRELGRTGIPVTELRASIIIGSGSASFEIIRDLVKKLPVMITPRWVKSLCQPIAIRIVLDYLLGVIEKPETAGQIFDIGGKEVLSYADMMRQVAEVMNKKIYIISLPVLTPRLSAYWLNLVTTVPMSIAFPLIDGLRNDTVCQNQTIDRYVKVDKRPFREAVQMALYREKKYEIESRWTEADTIDSSVSHRSESGHLSDNRQIRTNIPARHLFECVQQIGGERGWYYGNWAWKLRGQFDRLIGGVGMRRGRRHPIDIRVGDVLDFWRVAEFEPDHRLKLQAEMKLPGIAWLEFKVDKINDDTSVFHQMATFIPQNWFGYLYWYVFAPAHYFIFRNMALNIIRIASKKMTSSGEMLVSKD